MALTVLRINIVKEEQSKEILIDKVKQIEIIFNLLSLLIDLRSIKFFIENLIILKELKSKLYDDQCIMNFSIKMFHKINEIVFDPKGFNYSMNREIQDNIHSKFIGLKALQLKRIRFIYNKDNIIPSLEKLVLNSCDILEIENFKFQGFKCLRDLELKQNSICTLSPQAFHNLPFLEILDISYNSIRDLPDNIFSQLSSLKSLNLSYNPISVMKKEALNGLHCLENFIFYFENTLFKKDLFDGLNNLRNIEIKEWNHNDISMRNNRFCDVAYDHKQMGSCFEVDLPKNLERAILGFYHENFSSLNLQNSAFVIKILDLTLNSRDKIDNSYFINLYQLEDLRLSNVDLDLDKFPAYLNK